MEQKIKKMILVFKTTPFVLRMANSHNLKQDTCHQQSMCEQTPLRFHISLREVFTKLLSLRVMKIFDKSSLMKISQMSVTH